MSALPDALLEKIRAFCDERDWAPFHNPKDMAIAISLEAGELLEHFLWKNPEEVTARVESHREAISEEIAAKYPVEKARGSAAKYNEL
jgi:NTP pyrophosphatase (non-canonical NTP hydrolase)